MSDVERLTRYYPFSDAVLSAVSEASASQRDKSFSELADNYGIADGPEQADVHGFKPIELLSIKPKSDYDEHHARVFHAPFDITVQGVAAKAMRLFAAEPTTQLIAIGSLASIGNPYNKLRLLDLWRVRHGNLEPVVEPHLAYLESIGITSNEQTGFSWGGDKALASSGRLAVNGYGIKTTKVVSAETVSMAERSVVLDLLPRFIKAGRELENYQQASYVPTEEDKPIKTGVNIDTEFVRWAGGMAKLSNIAIEGAMAKDNLSRLVRQVLTYNPDTRVAVAWGASSEMVLADNMREKVGYLNAREHNPGRIIPMILEGMHHAGGDDLDLLTAIILQGLETTA